MRFLVPFSALLLAACSSTSTYDPPIVDMRGVDANRYNQDLGECTALKAQKGFTVGQPISDCLEARGYRVIARKT